MPKILTGFKAIDNITQGLHPGELVIVAARPGMGKTSFCLNIARNAAVQYKVPVLYFSLDMSKGVLGLRMLSSEALVDHHMFRRGLVMKKEDISKISTALNTLSEAPIYIYASSSFTILEIWERSHKLKAEHGLGLLVIDCLWSVTVASRTERRVLMLDNILYELPSAEEISDITRELKAMAKALNIPVIAVVNHLSHKVNKRPNKRPVISDLKKHPAIIQEADIIFFIYRDAYYYEHTNEKNAAEIIIAKNTNGPRGTIELIFQREYARFAEKNYSKPTSLNLLKT